MEKPFLSHVSASGEAQMVDVGHKPVTARRALAEARIWLPQQVAEQVEGGEIHSAKGPVLHTARIAGIMAAKRTSEWIPLCHPMSLDVVNISFSWNERELIIQCEAKVQSRTGVEMEALTGASASALTVYDMCKAVSHDIEIRSIRLLEKSGGKHVVKRNE